MPCRSCSSADGVVAPTSALREGGTEEPLPLAQRVPGAARSVEAKRLGARCLSGGERVATNLHLVRVVVEAVAYRRSESGRVGPAVSEAIGSGGEELAQLIRVAAPPGSVDELQGEHLDQERRLDGLANVLVPILRHLDEGLPLPAEGLLRSGGAARREHAGRW